MTTPTATTRRTGFSAALFYRDYLYFWVSSVGVNLAMSIEQVVLSWLVLELTNSPALVGVVGALRFVGMGLGPFLGALADRFDRRKMLALERAANVLYALAFVGLYYLNRLGVGVIFTLALVGGVLRAVDFTARTAIIPDIVRSHHLTPAVGLLFAGIGISMIVGPLLGGYLFEPLGTPGSFLMMAAIYLAAYLALIPMRTAPGAKPTRPESAWASSVSGIRYVLKDKTLFALFAIATIPELFCYPAVFGILSVYARDVLNTGSAGLGLLTAAEGVGGLLGSLISSGTARVSRKGTLLVIFTVGWSVALGAFGLLRSFALGMALLAAAGLARGLAMSLLQLMMLVRATPEMRGRVSGVRMFAIALLPVGNIASGAGAGLWGVVTMFLINALAGVVTTGLLTLWAPELFRRE